MKRCILFKNLFGYDNVSSLPTVSDNLKLHLLVDSEDARQEGLRLGWTVHVTDMFKEATSPKEKRDAVAFVNAFPEVVIPELKDYDQVFICDSNVLEFDPAYFDFINSCSTKATLYVTSGAYTGERGKWNANDVATEYERSMKVTRWKYDSENIKRSWLEYKTMLNDMSVSEYDVPVVSAKYIGWNLKSESKSKVADFVLEEYKKHLQGNIIFSIAAVLFKDDVHHFYHGFENTKLGIHKACY
jgi:hypothetical protein